MNSATPALLALLLVCSLVAIPVAAGPGDGAHHVQTAIEDRTTNNKAADETSNRLLLDGETRSEAVVYGDDLGALLVTQDDDLRADYTQYVVVDREFEAASNSRRKAMVEEAYRRIDKRASELVEREQNAVRLHAANELSTEELLQIMVRNYREATVLSDALRELDERANRIPGYSLSDGNRDIEDDRDALEMHRTPVRAKLESSANGHSDTTVVVETSQNGYVISYLGTDYVREAARYDNREHPNYVSQFGDISDAFDKAKELYPWVFENNPSSSAAGYKSVNLYQVETSYDQGRLDMYLDGGTGNVYREVQVLRPELLPTETETVWSKNGLNLTVNETPADGPAEVSVVDAETGEPVSATITVDGIEMGTTDSDGTLQFVPPANAYNLTVETASESVEVTVPED